MPEENRVILLQRLVLREAVLLLWESRCASLDYSVSRRGVGGLFFLSLSFYQSLVCKSRAADGFKAWQRTTLWQFNFAF